MPLRLKASTKHEIGAFTDESDLAFDKVSHKKDLSNGLGRQPPTNPVLGCQDVCRVYNIERDARMVAKTIEILVFLCYADLCRLQSPSILLIGSGLNGSEGVVRGLCVW